MTDQGTHEVVIGGDDGLDEEHAQLIRKQLLRDGFHDHVVSVRSSGDSDE